MHLKSGDTVVVISGNDKGKKGKVLKVLPKQNKVIIEGINMITKHIKPQGQNQQGGRITKEGPMDVSKVMYYCNKDKTGVRVGYKILDDGSKVRVCKKCGEELN